MLDPPVEATASGAGAEPGSRIRRPQTRTRLGRDGVAPGIDLAPCGHRGDPGPENENMRDHRILLAIDEAFGADTRCTCGRELFPRQRGDMLWLECPVFAGTSRLPARIADFAREFTHDRRPMAPIPAPVPVAAPLAAATRAAVPAVRPAAARS